MLYSEFVTLTGMKVSIEEYDCVEQSYYDSKLDKTDFCKLWKQDYDNGKWAIELALRRRLRHMTEELKEREKKIAKLEEQLEREQEWKLSDRAGTHMSQENYLNLRYLALRTDCCGRVLSESDAKKLIVEEFNFQLDKIEIITEVETFEVSRHYRLRRKDTYTREPIYNATDWNYIRFNVGNLQYEMINGELEQYCD